MTSKPRIEVDVNRAFITLLPQEASGVRAAIKDLIDIEGVVTTAGSLYVAEHRAPAASDAKCLAGLRAARVDIVGKTNLHELAFGTTGLNMSYGTPINPLDGRRIPGGSSSGSAVAVATGECDFALGTDTGGSVRIPSACCGTAGLKTTFGRIPTDGIWPLAPRLDIVGPMARDVAGLAMGMALLEPGFRPASDHPTSVVRLPMTALDPRIDRAVDSALDRAGFRTVNCDVSGKLWESAIHSVDDIIAAEAAQSNEELAPFWEQLESGPSLVKGAAIAADPVRLQRAYRHREAWQEILSELVNRTGLLALPTLEMFPPYLEAAQQKQGRLARFTSPVSLSGLPAIVVPIPSTGPLPASLQLVGSWNSEDMLLAAGATVESALRADQ